MLYCPGAIVPGKWFGAGVGTHSVGAQGNTGAHDLRLGTDGVDCCS